MDSARYKKKLQLKNRTTTTVFMLIAMLGILALLISLGVWQLKRSEGKKKLLTAYETHTELSPVPLETLKPPFDNYLYRPILISGHYDAAHPFLLDNRIQNHQAGYEVLSPFIINNDHKIIFVDRGFIAAPQSRAHFPDFQTPNNEIELIGYLKVPSAKQFTLSKKISEKGWPKRIQKIDLNTMAEKLNSQTYPFYLLQKSDTQDNLSRQWKPQFISPEKHTAYAVQWFIMAIVWFGLCCIVIFKMRKKNRDQV